jgi:hypothetical protein
VHCGGRAGSTKETSGEDYTIDHTGVTYLVGRERNISASGPRILRQRLTEVVRAQLGN